MPDFAYITLQDVESMVYYRLPKELIKGDLFKKLSCESKILYAVLRDRVELSIKNKWVDENDHVYIIYSGKEIDADLGCSKNSRIKYLNELEEYGLITRKHNVGYPDWIYVHNFSVINSPPLWGGAKNEPPSSNSEPGVVQSLNPNKNYNNKTDNKTDQKYSFLLPDDDENESEMKEKKEKSTPQTFKCLSQEEFLLMKSGFHYDYHQEFKDAATFNALVSQLEDLLTRQRKVVRVHGQVMLWETVANRLMKITEDDLDYASICVERFNKKINNPNAFFTTVLWDCVGNGETGIANLAKADFGFS